MYQGAGNDTQVILSLLVQYHKKKKIRETDTSQLYVNDYIKYYNAQYGAHNLGMGFTVHRNFVRYIKNLILYLKEYAR